MAVVETTRESWISRLGGAIKGIVAGLVLFILGFPVLFWNEGNSVRTAKALAEGEGACVALDGADRVDPDCDGRLVHVTGQATTQDVLADEEFGIAENAIRLERGVEMFQWVEHSRTTEKKNVGGSVTRTTTYTYEKEWSDGAVDSSSFREPGHDNPAAIPFEGKTRLAQEVRLGAFRLGERQISRIGRGQELALGAEYKCPVAGAQCRGGTVYIPGPAAWEGERDIAAQPQVGDIRVTFSVVRPHAVSIVARQLGDTFAPYIAKNGKKLDMLVDGERDSAEMFADARRGNATMTWLLRAVGFMMMFMGLSMVLRPLSVVGDIIPFVGTVVGMGTGFVAGAVSFACALVTVAIAWIFYRPVLGIALLAIAGLVAWMLWKRKSEGARA